MTEGAGGNGIGERRDMFAVVEGGYVADRHVRETPGGGVGIVHLALSWQLLWRAAPGGNPRLMP